jgi:hypothetical protein
MADDTKGKPNSDNRKSSSVTKPKKIALPQSIKVFPSDPTTTYLPLASTPKGSPQLVFRLGEEVTGAIRKFFKKRGIVFPQTPKRLFCQSNSFLLL